MQSQGTVIVEAGRGIVGDRYHGTRHRHVTIQSASKLDEASRALGAEVPAGRTRRNITLSHGELTSAPGDRLRIGNVVMEVVRIAAPCRIMDDEIAPGAMAALHQRGGTVFRVLEGGTISVGDVVVAETTPTPPTR